MPIYTYRNIKTGEIKDLELSIADRNKPTESGEWVKVPSVGIGKSRTKGFGRKGEW